MNVSVIQPMRSSWRGYTPWVATIIVVATIAFLASPNGPLGGFWRPAPDMPVPSSGQLPLLILLNVVEVLVFGLGIAFALFGYRLLGTAGVQSRSLVLATYVSIVWLLAGWWPHDSLHMANGMALGGLIAIEYGFHVTSMIAGSIVAVFFLNVLRRRSPVEAGGQQ